MGTSYDGDFFASIVDDSRRSARRMVPLVMAATNARSVVDVGCGTGAWLAEFAAAGVADILGFDGDYVDRNQLIIPREAFRAADLSQPLRQDRRANLAISLEVAEHLPPERSETLVADLTRLAPAVLFSAAVPGQGGVKHINERWQDEWAGMFATHGYRPLDIVRGAVWEDEMVMPWYAQNTLLYVSEGVDEPDHLPLPLRIVHPRLVEMRLEAERVRQPPLSEVVGELPSATRRWLTHQVRRVRSIR